MSKVNQNRPFYRKKRWLIPAVLVVLLGVAFVFRFSLLQAAGNALIDEDEPQTADCIFALGGNAFDRGTEAARLYNEGFSDCIVTTGANSPPNYKAINMEMPEAEVTKRIAVQNGVPARKIEALLVGTSTMEEAIGIIDYCVDREYHTAIVVSDKFHTNRVRSVFEPMFEEAGIELILCGAPSTRYSERGWWKSEAGLIMVNNEYVKLVYYWFKY